MNPGRNRWLLRLAIVLFVGLAVVFWSASQSGSRTLTIENRSEQTAAELNITISGQTSTYQNIKAGDEAAATGSPRGNDFFTVEGRLADGTRVRASGRIGESVHFLLLPGGKLQQRRKGQP